MVADDLGDPSSVVIFDETGFLKKGDESIGVSKQYCGGIGKVENCQVGVFAAYASPHGYALVDKRKSSGLPFASEKEVESYKLSFVVGLIRK